MKYTVFRVQDSDGRGPWKPNFSHAWVHPRPEHDDILIPFYEEFKGIRFMSDLFMGSGCLTLGQLRKWFIPLEYARLLRLGFRAVSMEVDGLLAISRVQCVFERKLPLREEVQEVKLY